MVRGNDLVGSDAIETVKGEFFPLERSLRKSVKNFDFPFPDFISKNGSFLSINQESLAQFSVEKNITDGYGERDEAGNSAYLLQFLGAWPACLKGFLQGRENTLKFGRKNSRNVCDQGSLSGIVHFACDVKGKRSMKEKVIKSFCDGGSIKEEETDLPVEFLVGFLFDPVIQNLQKLNIHEQSSRLQLKKFNHVDRLASVVEGKRADVNSFWANMKFARVGGVLPFCSIAGVASSDKEDSNGEERYAGGLEHNAANASQKVASRLATRKPLPVEISVGSFLKSAFAGGVSCAMSTALMHPVDTIKVQSVASFCGTLLGTVLRIPCEVLKQRLQAGLYNNVGEAFIGTCHQDGLNGFFRGTGPTLLRELPFYVAGMGLYAESKKAAQHLLRRELEPWETMAVGALSGGFTAVLTTPIDVIKTRMMTAHGANLPFLLVGVSIIRGEGPLGLFRGAIPRFFWVAPLGALNFAGYELILKAMDGGKGTSDQRLPKQPGNSSK